MEIATKNRQTLARRDIPDGPMPSLLMALSVIGLWSVLAGLLVLPLPIAMLFGALVYSGLATAELRAHIVSPITLVSAALFWLAAIAIFADWRLSWLPYSGSLFLGTLFLVSGGLLALGKPFTTFYSAGRGHHGKHWFVSGMWTSAYLVGAVLAWALMPSLSFVLAPMLIMAGAGAITLWVNMIWFGGATRRERSFELEGFRFSQVDKDLDDLVRFYDLAAKEFWPAIRQSRARTVESLGQLRERLAEGDLPYETGIIRFIAWHGEEAIGTICCVLDGERGELPVEKESGCNLDALRARGGVMEIGKFAIAQAYRTRQPVFLGLLRCAIEVSMERCIPFVANDSYLSQTGLYKRIGFNEILDAPFEDGNGAPCTVLVLNLALAVVYEGSRTDNNFMNRLIPILNGYLTERCYHRLALGFLLKPRHQRPFELGADELRTIANGGST